MQVSCVSNCALTYNKNFSVWHNWLTAILIQNVEPRPTASSRPGGEPYRVRTVLEIPKKHWVEGDKLLRFGLPVEIRSQLQTLPTHWVTSMDLLNLSAGHRIITALSRL